MNNKLISSTKKINAIFLAIVLVAGTITALSSSSTSSFMVQVEAQTYDDGGMDNRYNIYDNKKSYETNSYEPKTSYEPTVKDYEMDDNSYQKTYGNDNGYDQSQYQSYGKDNRDKSKDNSKSVSLNKIKCINTNININGNNTGDINLGNKGAAEEGGYSDAYSSGDSGGYGSEGYSKQDKGFECIIDNNNTNVVAGAGNVTTPPEQLTCEECFNANLTLAGIITDILELPGGISLFPVFPDISIGGNVMTIAQLCDYLEEQISEGIIPQTGLIDVINAILERDSVISAGVSEESVEALYECLLDVDFG